MPPEVFEGSATAEAFASDVVAFAAAQSSENLATLVCFFHLAHPDGDTKIDLNLDEGGRMTLTIQAGNRHD